MQSKTGLVLALVFAAVLAGCSSPPPSGNFVNANYAQPFQGSAQITYVPFNSGGNPVGTVPNGEQFECVQDAGEGTIPPESPIQPCTDPATQVSVAMTALPVGPTYTLYFADGPADSPELKIADLLENGTATNTFDADYTGVYKSLQLRVGDFVYATGSTAAGPSPLTANPEFSNIKVTGTFKGKDLMLTVSGLPANATYIGRLYAPDPAAPNGLAPLVDFPVNNGQITYTLTDKTKVADYKEFHIHYMGTAINLYKATNTPAS